jgi:hypothetical protein
VRPIFFLVRHYGIADSFFTFLKTSSFASKPKGICLRFYQQMSVHDKNGSKILISSP